MTDQHHGPAPCGCELRESGVADICAEHKQPFVRKPKFELHPLDDPDRFRPCATPGDGPWCGVDTRAFGRQPWPWEAAQAVQEFVRAVHLSVRWERSRARLWHSKRRVTESPPVHAVAAKPGCGVMPTQHYGTAPCGCHRQTDLHMFALLPCREHAYFEPIGDGTCKFIRGGWDAAQAIEEFVRAVHCASRWFAPPPAGPQLVQYSRVPPEEPNWSAMREAAACGALEAGLRAIAGWPRPHGTFSSICGGPACSRIEQIDGPGFMIGYEFHGPECPRTVSSGAALDRLFAQRERKREGVYRVEVPSDTERCADTMAVAFGLDAAERDELKGALVGIRRSLDALSGGTERPPAPRTQCYFCNGPVIDNRCTRCEARQP